MPGRSTLLVDRAAVSRLLTIAAAVEAVEAAFQAYGEGRVQMPPKPYLSFDKGDLRCMPAYIPALGLATVKNVNVHPGNSDLPTVMGTVTVFDPETGFPLAIMDGTYLTAMRTGAAGGVAAKYLARPDSAVAGFVGAGVQAATQLAALLVTMPSIERVLVSDVDEEKAARFAEAAAARHGLDAEAAPLSEVVSSCDILTTVTPVRKPIIRRADVQPGTHINAIGADAPGKQELEVEILRHAAVVIDSWEQGSHGGEINVAVGKGLFSREDVHADIGEVVSGRKPGRENDDQITVFDSTGLAIQDCACAARVYRALTAGGELGEGATTFDFMGPASPGAGRC
jgi:alanine dehydrogenase